MTRFDALVALCLVASIFGWPSLIPDRLPQEVKAIIFIVVLLVLLLLGVVRF